MRMVQRQRRFSCFRAAAALVVSSGLAGCTGAGSVLTPAHGADAPLAHTGKGTAAFTIKVPYGAKHAAGARGPRYISPATESLGISITGTNGTPNPTNIPAYVNLTPTSAGCSSSLASTICTLALPLPAGTYDASLSTYDQTGGAGNLLSQAQNVAFTVVTGTANTIPLTLGGIPKSVILTPFAPGYLRGGTGGLTLYGPGAQKLVVEALDADNNIIAGAGAPTLAVTPSVNGALTVTGPTTAVTNVVTLQAPTSGSPAVVTPRTLLLAVTATPTSQSGAAQFTANIPLRIAHSALYVSLELANAVDVFYDGNVNGASPNFQITMDIDEPNDVAVDAAGTVYVTNGASSTVTEYPAGSTSPSVTISNGLNEPYGLAVDTAGTVYVANFNANATVTEYPAGSTSSSSPSVTISNGLNYPAGVAVDAARTLYVANSQGSNVTEYPAGSSSSSSPSVTIGNELSSPAGVAVDAAGTLYVADFSNNNVTEFPAGSTSSTSPSGTISNEIHSPHGAAVDAAATVYVANNYNSTVTEYPAGSSSSSAPSVSISNVPGPQGVFAVPGPLTP
jgi:hypothetical protein